MTDQLAEKLPDTAGGTGTVVYQTTDGSAFTEQQKQEISDLASSAEDLDGVASVIDPFDAQQQQAVQAQDLADGKDQIDGGRAQLDAGQTQLDDGRTQLDAGLEQLTTARSQAEAGGAPAEQLAALDAQIAALNGQLTELDAQQKTIDESRDELDANAEKVDLGSTLLDLTNGIGVVSEDGSTAIVNVSFEDLSLIHI